MSFDTRMAFTRSSLWMSDASLGYALPCFPLFPFLSSLPSIVFILIPLLFFLLLCQLLSCFDPPYYSSLFFPLPSLLFSLLSYSMSSSWVFIHCLTNENSFRVCVACFALREGFVSCVRCLFIVLSGEFVS